MTVKKVVMAGNSRAVRIPKKCQLNNKEVGIDELPDGNRLLRKKSAVPAGYRNILEYYVRNPFGKPMNGFTELCNTDSSQDSSKS